MKNKKKITVCLIVCILTILVLCLSIHADETITITNQPTSTTYTLGSKVYVHVDQVGGDTYKWQIATRGYNIDRSKDLKDGEWEEGMIVSGSDTSTLCLENVPVSYNKYVVRCVITKGDEQVISNSATLTYQESYDVCIDNVVIANGKYKCTNEAIYRVNEKSDDYNISLSDSILTLNNLSLGRYFYPRQYTTSIGVYITRNVNIQLVGKSNIVLDGEYFESAYGIYSLGDTIISGDGSLTVKVDNAKRDSVGIYSKSVQIRDKAHLFIKTGNINEFSSSSKGSVCILTTGDVNINGGDIDLTTGTSKTQSEGINCQNIEVTQGKLSINSQKVGIKTKGSVGFTFTGGECYLYGKYYALDLSAPCTYNENLTYIGYANEENPSEIKPWTKFVGMLNTNFKYLYFSRNEDAISKQARVYSIENPKNGAFPSYEFIIETDFYGEDVDEAYIEWYRCDYNATWGDSNINKVASGEVFERGKYYFLSIYYGVKDGYKIDDNFDLRLDSNKFVRVNTYIDETKDYAIVIFKMNTPIPGIGDKVKSIFVSGLYSPIVGNPLWYPTLEYASDPGDAISKDNSHWEYSSDGSTWISVSLDDSKKTYFESDKLYKYVCSFTLSLGYEYSDDVKAYLNGNQMAKLDGYNWEYVFGKPSGNREDAITSFSILGIPRYLYENDNTINDVKGIQIDKNNITFVQDSWYLFDANNVLHTTTGHFEFGQRYVRKIMIACDYPHYFDTEKDHLKYDRINGEEIKNYSTYVPNANITKADYVVEWELDRIYLYVYYPFVGCEEEKIIDKISIETATIPEIGKTLNFGYTILDEGVIGIDNGEHWSISTNGKDYVDVYPGIVNTIEEGEIYRVNIKCKVKDGYYLSEAIYALINGQIANLTIKGDTITIDYTYPKLVNVHTHSYTLKNPDSKYLFATATCTSKAKYYYSCTCGEHNSETFEYGDYLAHTYGDNYIDIGKDGHKKVCTVCGKDSEVLGHIPNIDDYNTTDEIRCIYCGHIIKEKTPETKESETTSSIETTNVVTETIECKHKLSDNYSYDEKNHWRVCSICSQKIQTEEHTFKDGKCIICSYENGAKNNSSSTLVVWILVGVIVIALCALVIIVITKRKDNPKR